MVIVLNGEILPVGGVASVKGMRAAFRAVLLCRLCGFHLAQPVGLRPVIDALIVCLCASL